MNSELKSRFIDDNSLPFRITEEPYFSYYIDLYEPLFLSKTKYKLFCDTVEHIQKNSGIDLFTYEKNIRNSIIDYFNSNNIIQDFTEIDEGKYRLVGTYPKGDIYNDKNVGKIFTSIDMKKANFQVFKFLYNDRLPNTYDDLIQLFTQYRHIIHSKIFRQIIFGNKDLLPQRQAIIQRYIIDMIIKSNSIIPIVVSNDEIIVDGDYAIVDALGFDLKRTVFTLRKLPWGEGYVKEYIDGTFEFKQVPAYIYAQVYKKYKNLPILEFDRKFLYEGFIATFDTCI